MFKVANVLYYLLKYSIVMFEVNLQQPVITSPVIRQKDGRITDSCLGLIGPHQCGVVLITAGWKVAIGCHGRSPVSWPLINFIDLGPFRQKIGMIIAIPRLTSHWITV